MKSHRFPDHLILEDAGTVNGSRLFSLESSFRYIGTTDMVTVPAGFVTDGASVPRVFWNILQPFGEYFEAAIIHDYLYSPRNRFITRERADAIFLEAMKEVGVGWLTRRTIYRAVRLFGWTAFKGHNPN